MGPTRERRDKRHPVIAYVKDAVDQQYAQGRTTNFGDEELELLVRDADAELYREISL